jgi:VanZ family protein
VFQYKFSILLAIVIVLLSLAPSSRLPDTVLYSIPYIDKITHCFMYGSLGFVALMESRCSRQCSIYHFIILFGILLVSVLIEVLQATVVPSRAAEWADVLANSFGLLGGYLVFRLFGGFRIFRFLKS